MMTRQPEKQFKLDLFGESGSRSPINFQHGGIDAKGLGRSCRRRNSMHLQGFSGYGITNQRREERPGDPNAKCSLSSANST